MNIINYNTREIADELYNNSALTMEGLAEESIPDLIEWIKQYTAIKNENVYVIKGKDMDIIYGLTGSNAYPDDCTIISVKLEDMESPMAVAIPRFQIGARWYDDIVDNNARREAEKE